MSPEITDHINESEHSVPRVTWLLCSNVVNSHLKLAIESCLSQSFQDFELILVANGPVALDVAKAVKNWFGTDTRLRIFTTPVRQLSFSLSLGLHYARGLLVARMDGDDISRLDRLERQVAFMDKNPDVVLLGTAYEIIDENGQVQRSRYMPESNKSIRKALLYGNPFCHPSVMFRRQVVLEEGGYLGGLHAEDYDLWCRLSLNSTYSFANLNQVCLGYRVFSIGVTRRSRWAYASVTASQFRNFCVGGGVCWSFAALLSVFKLFFRSPPLTHLK